MKIIFASRVAAENLTGDWSDWSVISITEPVVSKLSLEPVKFKNSFMSELHLQFNDSFHGAIVFNQPEQKFATTEDAQKIVKFIEENQESDGFFVHCKQGVSRSAAIAKYLALRFSESFNDAYQDYNKELFDLLVQEHKNLKVM